MQASFFVTCFMKYKTECVANSSGLMINLIENTAVILFDVTFER